MCIYLRKIYNKQKLGKKKYKNANQEGGKIQ